MWIAGFEYLIKSTREVQFIMKKNHEEIQRSIERETIHFRKSSMNKLKSESKSRLEDSLVDR